MTARTIATSICRPLARPVAGSGDGGNAWTPDQLTNVLQRMDSFAYASSLIGGLPVVESSLGTAAVPRGQRCVLFDGVDDAAVAANSTVCSISAGGDLTITAWVKQTSFTGFRSVLSKRDGSNTNYELSFNNGDGRFGFFSGGSFTLSTSALALNTWGYIAIVCSGSTATYYLDGVQVGTAAYGVAAPVASVLNIGRASSVAGHFSGNINDVRIYSVAKSASEIQAIFNQHLTPTTLDRTGLLAAWWLNEESGTTHYDWSGNGRNLTATNVTQSTYHATDAGVRYNAANELGYTLSGAVVIPRNEAVPTQDAAGGSLQFSGPIKLNATMEVPCLTVTGTEFLALAHLTGSETVVSSVGTSTPSIGAGRINLTAGTISSILLSDGTRLPLQEGAGTGNTNRTCYNVDGTGRHATLTNGTVATMWAGRLNTVRDWCLQNGGTVSSGVFIPGLIGSNLDAAGNAKGIAAGTHGNPYSRFVPNFWSAPSLVNIGSDASDLYAPSGMAGVTSESTADTRYANTRRYLATRAALTGSDKTNAEGWVA